MVTGHLRAKSRPMGGCAPNHPPAGGRRAAARGWDQRQEKTSASKRMRRFFGAGDRTRTGTVSPPVDFESTTSTNSITPAWSILYKKKSGLAR